MRVLLIQPPIQDFYQTRARIQPLGLAYLAAALETAGFEVAILDAQSAPTRRTLPLAPDFAYMRPYYTTGNVSPFRLFGPFYHFGLSFDAIEARVREIRPDAVGITSLFSPYHDTAAEVARVVKKVDRRIPVVFGGTHPTVRPDEVLADPNADFVVLGEGEVAFRDLLLNLEGTGGLPLERIPGIGYKNGKIRVNREQNIVADLDRLPYPARHLLDPDAYAHGGRRATMILTSRGCPYRCQFCSIPFTLAARYRKRAPEKVVAEIVHCHERYGMRSFDIEDDNFTVDVRRAGEILDLLGERFPDGSVELSAMNGISTTTLSPRLLEKMKRAGFRRLNIALVTEDEDTRREMERPESNAHFSAVVRAAHETGLATTSYLIFGLPGQTLDEMIGSVLYLMERPVRIGPSFFYPVPGSVHYRVAVENGWIPDGDFGKLRSSLMPVETRDAKRDELVTFFHLVRIINFLKELLCEDPPGPGEERVEDYVRSRIKKRGLEGLAGAASFRVPGRLAETSAGLLLLAEFFKTGDIGHMKVAKRDPGATQYIAGKEVVALPLIRKFFKKAAGKELRAGNFSARWGEEPPLDIPYGGMLSS